MTLAEKTCVPCLGGVPPLTHHEFEPMLKQLNNWDVIDNCKLVKKFYFSNFIEAMELANKIAVIAEEQGHHPDLHIRWGELLVEIWTHKINGLSESDFILAAKIDCAQAAA